LGCLAGCTARARRRRPGNRHPAQAVELAEHLGRLAAPSLPRVQAKGKPLLYRTVGPSDGLEPIRAKDVAEEAVAQMIEPKGRRPQKKKRRKGR
jgi:hypothetical protein